MNTKKPIDVDQYIAGYSGEIQLLLRQIRSLIKKAAPGAEECISYGMPAYKQSGPLVYFAVCKNHIGFYPTGEGIKAFSDKLSKYNFSKGAIQFPLDKPMPAQLITSIVKHRVQANQQKASSLPGKISK